MSTPLMPKATAVWLVENTTLTFGQIAEFCGLHPLEVKGIADGDVANGVKGQDPIMKGIVTRDNLEAAEKDPKVKLQVTSSFSNYVLTEKKRKKTKYTPVARRQDKPDAIAWLLKKYPKIKDTQIVKLIGTTKKTINDIRNKSYWNMANLKPRDPVLLGLCTQTSLEVIASKLVEEEEQNESKKKKAS
jgi:hypothetical protein